MGRPKSTYKLGETPVFKYYKNRKTYFTNTSSYVNHEEIRKVISESNGAFEIHGEISKEKFLMKILTVTSEDDGADVLYRAVKHGGLISYIKMLEKNHNGIDVVTPAILLEQTTLM